ncbi:hypothetical protein FRC09_016016 [Ceratobasidium sp. 395]|nr:hypothetical protein FRC09_016016 [Ceratobasidium sp. 395]
MGTSTPSVLPIPATSSGLGKGAKAGVAIGVLAIVSLFVLAALLWFRRRQARAGVFEKNKAAFERICSKCRLEITGDYRLECVQPDCPAAVDLHPECKDWNVQVNHDHEVHEVPNK